MAWEHKATPPWSAVANSTGLKPRRFCTINTSKKAQYPANGAPVVGAMMTGSTGSTSHDTLPVSILSYGVARIEAAGGVLAAGAQCQATSAGRASTMTAGAYAAGFVVGGSSGTTGRVLSVLLLPIGTT